MTIRRLGLSCLTFLVSLLITTGFSTKQSAAGPTRAAGTDADRYTIRIRDNYFIRKDYGSNGNELLYRRPESPEADRDGETTPDQLRVTGITKFAWSDQMIVGKIQSNNSEFYMQAGEKVPFDHNRYFALQIATGRITVGQALEPSWGITADRLKGPEQYPWDDGFVYGKAQ